MKQIPASLITLVGGVVITLFSLWVGQHHGLLPEQASEQAPLVDQLFDVMVTIATALFIVVEGAIVWFLIRYRRPAGDESDGVPVEGNLPLEAFWTAIPAIIVIGLSIYSVDIFQQMGGVSPGSHAMHGMMMAQAVPDQAIASDVTAPMMAMADEDATPAFDPKYGYGANPAQVGNAPDLVVNVTGMQYAWIFNYPDSGIISGELHVPIGKDVQVNLSAQDVIHSFWVPQFRLKQDALPGQQTGLRFTATKEGSYPIVCAELCGSYHGGMRSQVVVQSQTDFESWMEQNRIASLDSTQAVATQAVATSPADHSVDEFLAPYAEGMGIDSAVIHQLHASQGALPVIN